MTAAAIWPGTGLEDVVFGTGEHRPGCTYRDCRAEACWAAVIVPLRECPHTRWLYCVPHAEATRKHARANNGLFKCRTCPGDDWELRFITMEPIR